MDILHRAAALEALYDSADSFPQPKCHPATRKLILENLFSWGTSDTQTDGQSSRLNPAAEWNNNGSPPAAPKRQILWLYGPAGAGKSAVMQTLAGRLQDAGCLGGSFFFKRDHPIRGNGKVMFLTLAYDLALWIPDWRTAISQSAAQDPSVVARSMAAQLQNLIIEPCLSPQGRTPATILIDGLDECRDHLIQCEILRLIGQAVRAHRLPLQFIIASRPEPHLREQFEGPWLADLTASFNIAQSFSDVERYLRDEFARIHSEHWPTMAALPSTWPSQDELDSLVLNSSGYFIYASTVIKFLSQVLRRSSHPGSDW
ncbi:hypothetical protein FB451DRAFT_1047135 [Mycena latifolia]|nr:hypothetical protein FB451DRAFT_1047135 [Mycena latifolia]